MTKTWGHLIIAFLCCTVLLVAGMLGIGVLHENNFGIVIGFACLGYTAVLLYCLFSADAD